MPQPTPKTSSSSCPANTSCCSYFRCILISILVFVAGLSAGLYIGGSDSSDNSYNPSSPSAQPSSQKDEVKKGSYEDGYQSALEFARKKLEEKGMFGSLSKSGKNMLSGVAVKSVSGKSITVEFDASLLDIFSEGTVTKIISVPDTVKIEKHTPKDPAEVQKAYDEFKKQMDEFGKNGKTSEDMKNLPKPPMSYTVENINISDLKAGDLLSIYCQADAAKPDTFTAISVEFVNPDLTLKTRRDANTTAPSDVVPPAKRSSGTDVTTNTADESASVVRTRTSEVPSTEAPVPATTRATPPSTETTLNN